MNDRMVSAVYGVLSAAVWGCTMALIAFMVFLFCSGRYRAPVFGISSVTVSQVSEADPALDGHALRADGWYKAEYAVNVQGAKFSPYTYTVNNVAFNAPDDIEYTMEYFVTSTGNIEYSKLSPADFTVTLYLRCFSSDAAKDIAMRSRFGFRGLRQNFAFFSKELVMDLPGFSVEDYELEPVIL